MKLAAQRGGPLGGTIAVPGDKSCSHRALILSAMAQGETIIEGLLESHDTLATVEALRAFGVQIESSNGQWRVRGTAWRSPAEVIDCGNSGTAARLLIGAVAGMEGVNATFTGDASLSARPMRRLTAPLTRMGARIEGGDTLPLTVHGARLGGVEHLNDPPSAQVKTALLLAGLGSEATVRVIEPLPSRDHGEIMLREFGAQVGVEAQDNGWTIHSEGRTQPIGGTLIEIGGDPSSAAFPLVAAAIVPGSRVRADVVNVNPLRTGLFETLETMGADISLSNERLQSGEVVADIEVAHAPLRPCHVTPAQIPAMIDEIPALAVACAFAEGESVIEGLSELKVKESDRLGAVVAGLVACGVTAIAKGDALHIFGRETVRGGGKVVTHGDHRIAMAFITFGLASGLPVEVDEAEKIDTSYPGFAAALRDIGAIISEVA